jgi:protein-S-isoprenylcysteine O-methyltransferase Ste14
MTLPLAAFLVSIFANLPESLPRMFLTFLSPFNIAEKALVVVGIFLLVHSVIHLNSRRGGGLVTSGPYGLVRHPQYLGMILFTLGLTGMSIWILNNTFGIGFLSPAQTIEVWLAELFAYVSLAYIEERHLSRIYGEAHDEYKRRVPFLVPILKIRRTSLEVALSIGAPTFLLFLLIWAQ